MHALQSLVVSSLFSFPFLLSALAVSAATPTMYANISTCTGGTLYFAAHPADTLLFQNPDLFHDLYVYKCTTTVIFTSGDRGLDANHSRSLEQGVEAAYSLMSGLADDSQAWLASTARVGNAEVVVSKHRDADNLQIVYLRLPDGGPVGSGYAATGGESLRKLYMGEIQSITTIDGSATYTLEPLRDLLAAMLAETQATKIRVLDFKTGIPDEEEEREDHADHAVSARLVVDVMKREKSTAELQGYAAGFARKFKPVLTETDVGFQRKGTAFLTYARYDRHMCKTYKDCLDVGGDNANSASFSDYDVLYAAEAMKREYYVS